MSRGPVKVCRVPETGCLGEKRPAALSQTPGRGLRTRLRIRLTAANCWSVVDATANASRYQSKHGRAETGLPSLERTLRQAANLEQFSLILVEDERQ